MDGAQLRFADGPCWTCRRRRVKCDSRLPNCFKCLGARRECLGYGKTRPLVWAGLASRGKLVGRTFHDITDLEHGMASRDASPSPAPSMPPKTQLEPVAASLRAGLTDPIFQDLGRPQREYISYYERRCCQEIMPYVGSDSHTTKKFMSMLSNPTVYHTILSISACHKAHSSMPSFHDINIPKAEQRHECSLQHFSTLPCHDQHAEGLRHSSMAIQALSQELNSGQCSDTMVVSTFLFGWLDMLESGKRAWMHHLVGMGKLLVLQRSLPRSPLRDYLEASFVMLSIFGSTTTSYTVDLESMFPGPELENILLRAERSLWLGCPGALIFILRKLICMSQLRPPAEEIRSTFQTLREFPCRDWARCIGEQDLDTRTSLACAFQACIEIYGRRTLDFEAELNPALVECALDNLLRIDRQSIYFKSCPWPALIVGLESQTAQQQEAVSIIYDGLVRYFHSWNVKRAIFWLRDYWTRPRQASWVEEVRQTQDGFQVI